MLINRNYHIGILALCALAIFYYGVLFLKGQNIYSEYNEYQIIYPVNKKLAVSSPVTFKGHEVGKVTKVELSSKHNYNTLVTIKVERRFPLSDKSKVMLYNMGITEGNIAALELELCAGQPRAKEDLILGEFHPNFSDADLNTLTKQMASVMTNLKTTVESVNTILNNFEKTSHALHTVICGVQHKINTISNNIMAIATPLANPVKGIPAILPTVHNILTEINAMPFGEFSCKTTDLLNNVLNMFEYASNNRGNLGRFIYDETLYNNLDYSIKHLNTLLFDIKKNPSRYVYCPISLLSFGKRP